MPLKLQDYRNTTCIVEFKAAIVIATFHRSFGEIMPPVSIPTGSSEMSSPKRPSFWSSLSEIPFISACQESLERQQKEGTWIGLGVSFFTTGVRTVLEPATQKLTETFPNAGIVQHC